MFTRERLRRTPREAGERLFFFSFLLPFSSTVYRHFALPTHSSFLGLPSVLLLLSFSSSSCLASREECSPSFSSSLCQFRRAREEVSRRTKKSSKSESAEPTKMWSIKRNLKEEEEENEEEDEGDLSSSASPSFASVTSF